jgi:hypothetical protein
MTTSPPRNARVPLFGFRLFKDLAEAFWGALCYSSHRELHNEIEVGICVYAQIGWTLVGVLDGDTSHRAEAWVKVAQLHRVGLEQP